MTISFDLPAEDATERLGQALAKVLVPGDLLILDGPLGAGKTFLSGAILHGLGLDEDEAVPSPTYSLVIEYLARHPVCHADLYRLRSEDEVIELGLQERRDQGAILLIEWGAPYAELLGGQALYVQLELEPRRALVLGLGEREPDLLRALGRGA